MTEPIKPKSALFIYRGEDPRSGARVYDHIDGTRILSAVENVTNDGLNYHVSMSRNGRRLTSDEATKVLMGLEAPFPWEQWFEDNHQSSIARNFWVHVDPAKRRPCECAAKEKPIVEGDFTWREV